MEGQSITLKIGGNEYALKAKSPEDEQLMRLAAEEVNSLWAHYNANYPNQSEVDKFAFVSLNQAMFKIRERRSAAKLADALDTLEDKLGAYLAGIEKNR